MRPWISIAIVASVPALVAASFMRGPSVAGYTLGMLAATAADPIVFGFALLFGATLFRRPILIAVGAVGVMALYWLLTWKFQGEVGAGTAERILNGVRAGAVTFYLAYVVGLVAARIPPRRPPFP